MNAGLVSITVANMLHVKTLLAITSAIVRMVTREMGSTVSKVSTKTYPVIFMVFTASTISRLLDYNLII